MYYSKVVFNGYASQNAQTTSKVGVSHWNRAAVDTHDAYVNSYALTGNAATRDMWYELNSYPLLTLDLGWSCHL